MIKKLFTNTIAGIEAKLQEPNPGPVHRKHYALEIAKLGLRLYSGDGPVAACGVAAPFELLNALGVSSYYVEFISGSLSSAGVIEAAMEEAELLGMGGDTCGYHRAVFGASRQGLVPIPDFLIGTTCPCSGGVAAIQELARYHNRDLFMLNVPNRFTEASIANLASQLKEMVAFVEEHTKIQLSKERLNQAVENTNQTRALLLEVAEIAAKEIPSLVKSKDLHNIGVVLPLLFGTPEAVSVAKSFRDEFLSRLEDRVKNPLSDKEKEKNQLRLMWIQNRIQFRNPFVDWLEKEYNAIVVADEFFNITWEPIDPQNPFTGFARRMMSFSINGPVERRIGHLQKMANDYHIHGAINPCHWGCRQGTGARGLISEGLKEVGVPVLNLEVDCVDPRNFSEGQLMTRLGAFAEMLSEEQL